MCCSYECSFFSFHTSFDPLKFLNICLKWCIEIKENYVKLKFK